MPEQKRLESYARLVVRIGVNLQKNQILVINSPIECAPFARLLAKEDLPTADSQTGKAKTPVRAPEESPRRLPQGAEPGQAVSGTGPVQ